jgi:hypothetical protein
MPNRSGDRAILLPASSPASSPAFLHDFGNEDIGLSADTNSYRAKSIIDFCSTVTAAASAPEAIGCFFRTVISREVHCRLTVQAQSALAGCYVPCHATDFHAAQQFLAERDDSLNQFGIERVRI